MRMRGAGGQILMTVPVLLGLAGIGLAGISALFGLAQPSWTVWMGAITGIAMGLGVGASLATAHDDRSHGSRHGTTTTEEATRATKTASA
jgi:hypothetical protein